MCLPCIQPTLFPFYAPTGPFKYPQGLFLSREWGNSLRVLLGVTPQNSNKNSNCMNLELANSKVVIWVLGGMWEENRTEPKRTVCSRTTGKHQAKTPLPKLPCGLVWRDLQWKYVPFQDPAGLQAGRRSEGSWEAEGKGSLTSTVKHWQSKLSKLEKLWVCFRGLRVGAREPGQHYFC